MSRIKSGWVALGKLLADFFFMWWITSVLFLIFIAIICLILVIAMGLAGLAAGGIVGAIDGVAEALEIIVEAAIASSEVIFWALVIWLGILFLGILAFILGFIADIVHNMWDNLFTPGASVWRGFWTDLTNNAGYAWQGLVTGAKGWGAKAKATINEGVSLVKKGVGWGIGWLKRKIGLTD